MAAFVITALSEGGSQAAAAAARAAAEAGGSGPGIEAALRLATGPAGRGAIGMLERLRLSAAEAEAEAETHVLSGAGAGPPKASAAGRRQQPTAAVGAGVAAPPPGRGGVAGLAAPGRVISAGTAGAQSAGQVTARAASPPDKERAIVSSDAAPAEGVLSSSGDARAGVSSDAAPAEGVLSSSGDARAGVSSDSAPAEGVLSSSGDARAGVSSDAAPAEGVLSSTEARQIGDDPAATSPGMTQSPPGAAAAATGTPEGRGTFPRGSFGEEDDPGAFSTAGSSRLLATLPRVPSLPDHMSGGERSAGSELWNDADAPFASAIGADDDHGGWLAGGVAEDDARAAESTSTVGSDD